VDEFYNFIEGLPEIILLVIIPILIFESGRKLKIGQIKKEAIPIGFFAIIGLQQREIDYRKAIAKREQEDKRKLEAP
jgi:hypothetical protein